MSTELWTNLNTGEITCLRHGGYYLQSAVANPNYHEPHITPLGTWTPFTVADAAEFVGAGLVPKCQTCGATMAA